MAGPQRHKAHPISCLLERFRYRFSFSAPSGGLGELGITPARRAALRASASTFGRAARLWFLQKSIRRDFRHLLKKQPLASRAGTHSLLVAPPDGAEKEKTKMSNEIAVQKEAGNGKPMVSWAALLNEAVTKPGFIHEAYSRFHNYSLGNQLLALFQCLARGIQPGPLATFPRWKELGRFVKKGEKALTLCMPLSCKRTKTVTAEDGTEREEPFACTHFAYKSHWFVLSQTDGADYVPTANPEWNEETALAALKIDRVAFESLDGNTQGYAKPGRMIAISPV